MAIAPQHETRWTPDDVARAVCAFGPQDLADLRRRLQAHGLILSQVRPPIPIVSVVGRSKVGKTTLLEKLIPELKRRGYGVATIKHHTHPGLEMDRPGKDTWRHAQAGSEHVLIAAPDRVASIRHVARALTLDEVAATVRDVDIVLTEGYKRAGKPQVEVVRAARSTEPIGEPGSLVALVSDVALALGVPVFGLEDVAGLADWLEGRFLYGSKR
jgi:molybdopterin-guanine dinucleotide biosynthesis protein B